MRVQELEICNVRGIKHLLLKPNGENFLLCGPNGSGKSAVVDALDFLLTGQISRLSGKGSSGMKLGKHGPHLDHKPADASVRAVIEFAGERPVELKRTLSSPTHITSNRASVPRLEKTLSLARQGHHLLTRKDLLNYITADAGTRGQQIQALLNISELENIRKGYVRAKNDLQGRLKVAQGEYDAAREAVAATMQCTTWSKDEVVKLINRHRSILGGAPLSAMNWRQLKNGLKLPGTLTVDGTSELAYLQNDLEYLCAVTEEASQEAVGALDRRIRALISQIKADSELDHALSHIKLRELGLTLLGEAGECPLCGTAWPPGKLHDYLQTWLARAKVMLEQEKELNRVAAELSGRAANVVASLEKILAAMATGLELKQHSLLSLWLKKLKALQEKLADPLAHYALYKPERIKLLLTPDQVPDLLQHLLQSVQNKENTSLSPQTAWDTLTRLEENLKALSTAKKNLDYGNSCHLKAGILLEEFLKARDTVLDKLYQDVEKRFAGLYRQLHGRDEGEFSAKLESSGAGVALGVDFHGRGIHPPHALHSEGHQDSMGICLYFALAEQLTGGLLDLIILDDVVLSMDDEHRLKLCNLFTSSGINRQLFITTHHTAWAQQLIDQGVVSSGNMLQLYDWSIDAGPKITINYGTH